MRQTCRALSAVAVLAAAVLCAAGCKLDTAPAGRKLYLAPAIIGTAGDPLGIDPAWTPPLPDRPGNRPDEAVGLVVFDEYLFPGEPATALLRLNKRNFPWRQQVQLAVWDPDGVNLLWQGAVTVEPDETYLVQVAPLTDETYLERAVQLRVRANMFEATRRLRVLSPPPVQVPGDSEARSDLLDAGLYPVSLPAGPVGPNAGPLVLLATPGETVAAAAVLWAKDQRLDRLAVRIDSPGAAGRPAGDLARWTRVEAIDPAGRPAPLPPEGLTLLPSDSQLLLAQLAVPPDARPGPVQGRWAIGGEGARLLLARPICLTVFDLSLPPPAPGRATVLDRYLDAFDALLARARASDQPHLRSLADRLEPSVREATAYYRSRPGSSPGDGLVAPALRFPFKLRWIILRACQPLAAAVPPARG